MGVRTVVCEQSTSLLSVPWSFQSFPVAVAGDTEILIEVENITFARNL